MTDETSPELLMALPPTICDKCGQEIVAIALSGDDGVTQILHFCPHHKTLAHATLAEVDGKRAVVKWIFESPVTQEYAITMAEKLGESDGKGFKVFHSGMLQ